MYNGMIDPSEVEQWFPGSEHEIGDYEVPISPPLDDYSSDINAKCLDYFLFYAAPAGTC